MQYMIPWAHRSLQSKWHLGLAVFVRLTCVTNTHTHTYTHTQRCVGSGLLSLSSSWGEGGSAASARWQVILRDPIRHAGSCSGVVVAAQIAVHFLYLLPFLNVTSVAVARVLHR